MPREWRIPLCITEHAGLAREREWVRLGVPLPEGALGEASAVVVADVAGRKLACQTRTLATWPDRTIQWLLVDVLVDVPANGVANLTLRPASSADETAAPIDPPLVLTERDDRLTIDTGAAVFQLGANGAVLLESVRVGGENLLAQSGAAVHLTGCSGRRYAAVTRRLHVEESGPILASIVAEGDFRPEGRERVLEFQARCIFLRGAAALRLEVLVRNPRAARHPGGLWDLSDRGTVLFEDLSLSMAPAMPAEALRWYAEGPDRLRSEAPGPWSLYQDSSGGENWDSANHLDVDGNSSVTFRGYRVRSGDAGQHMLIGEGDRATPAVQLVTAAGSIAATTADFWQNFPKALRWTGGALSVGLFPGESRAPHALQGGEQKRHTVFLEFLGPNERLSIPNWQQPVTVSIEPTWVEESRVIESFVAASRDHNEKYLRYVNAIVAGPHAFIAKRELIDEYGWRNFGELYADHEAVRHEGPRPLVSHYNNQYDFVHGALVHFLRTGDARWRQLGEEAARHTIDIDIYHTDEDRAAFNHGLFWHTDHHQPAATCTHRTYSARNGRGLAYGGGPSNEHNYTSGLLLYFYLTGDGEAARAVRELADWVVAMDDGSRSALGLIDPGPTGLASKTVDDGYHKAGRGAGNSINALLDAYRLTSERRYLEKAEELIRRCIHPADDVEALHLAEPESRWSYLVFLQILGKYLHLKLAWHESDYMLHYARASLLRYVCWIAAHEVPYKDVLDKVELPTETWPAHDIRKCHVLHLAAEFSQPSERPALREKAAFFFGRSLDDVLSFDTAFLTRPLVILCVYGHVHAYYQAHQHEESIPQALSYAFGSPTEFESPKRRWRRALPERIRRLVAKVGGAGLARLGFMRHYAAPSRL